MRFYQPPKLSQVCVVRLAREQQAAELILHFSDRARQGRLSNVACLRCPGEVECLAHREKIADLLHLHPSHLLTLASTRRSVSPGAEQANQLRVCRAPFHCTCGTISLARGIAWAISSFRST